MLILLNNAFLINSELSETNFKSNLTSQLVISINSFENIDEYLLALHRISTTSTNGETKTRISELYIEIKFNIYFEYRVYVVFAYIFYGKFENNEQWEYLNWPE